MKINCGLKSPTALRKVDSEGTEAVSMRELRTIFFATPGPHLRSDYALTAMRAGCRASHWKRGALNYAIKPESYIQISGSKPGHPS